MLKIGITGGIGTGKTTACKLFQKYNIPVYFADDRAKWLMNHQPELRESLLRVFGKKVYNEKGLLDRAYLGSIVFQDQAKLDELNSIVHPAVFLDGQKWQAEQEARGVPYSLKEAALLFETGSYLNLDKIIVVSVPDDIRIARVMQRNNATKEEVMARINKQMLQSEKEAKADFVLTNISLESLEEQVAELHAQLLNM